MPVSEITGADNFVLQEAISMYSDEAYTDARRLSSTGLVGSNPNIDTRTETFVGQVRWWKPLNPTINVASLTVATAGTPTSSEQDYIRYIKTVRTSGATKVNLQDIVTQEDGLAKYGRDQAEIRAMDEHNAMLAILKGVAISEALNGCAAGSGVAGVGGQTFVNNPTAANNGFFVDLGLSTPIVAASSAIQGAARAEGFLNAFGMAYKDHEPEWAYIVVSPEVMASLRSANLVDSDTVQDGNVKFETIFGGKFRLVSSRANQSLSTAELTKINSYGTTDIVGTKTTFIVLPGALAMAPLAIPVPTEIERNAAAYGGGGTTSVWTRWGYVLAPAGYDWSGNQEAFPSDSDYMSVNESGVNKALTAVTTIANASGVWSRKATSALSLGILPIFHS
jgi:hypothetical protein